MGRFSDRLKNVAAPRRWDAFQRATLPQPTEEQIAMQAKLAGQTRDEALATILRADSEETIWKNNLYTVFVRDIGSPAPHWPEMLHLSIKRNDREPMHDWRVLQRIKNEIVGPDHEAVELYPAERRVVDTANQYHLWVFKSPDATWPFGWTEGLKVGPDVAGDGGAKQRAFEGD
jgi:hypothetical protein